MSLCRPFGLDWNLKKEEGDLRFYHAPGQEKLEADFWFRNLQLKKVSFMFIYGIGLGYFYLPLRKWLKADPERFVVFFEDDLRVLRLFFETSIAELILKDPQVMLKPFETVIEGCQDPHFHSWGKFRKDFEDLFWAAASKECLLVSHPIYEQEKPKVCQSLHLQIQLNMEEKRYSLGQFSLGFQKCEAINSYHNLKFLVNTAHFELFKEEFSHVPALICGAGPKVKNQLTHLKKLEDKVLLFGAGSGMNVLTNFGITPHFFGGIDPTLTQVSRALTQFGFEVPLCFSLSFAKEALEVIQSPLIYASLEDNIPYHQWFEEKLGLLPAKQIPSVLSTSHFCFLLSKEWGCRPIVLAGMDLAYTEKKRYADQVTAHLADRQEEKQQIEHIAKQLVLGKDVFGREIETSLYFLQEANLYQNWISTDENKQIWNSSLGLDITAIPYRPLEDVFDPSSLKQYDFLNWVHAVLEISRRGVSIKRIKGVLSEWILSLTVLKQRLEENQKIDVNEPAYKFLLNVFKRAWERIEYISEWQIKFHPTSFLVSLKKERKERELSAYLSQICLLHLEAAKEAFLELSLETVSLEPCKPFGLKLVKNLSYKGNVLHGKTQFLSEDQTLLAESDFKEGKREGITRQYSLFGKLLAELNFKEGVKEGRQRYFFSQGSLRSELDFSFGQLHGKVLLFWPNGRCKRELHFLKGALKGVEKRWNQKGELLFEVKHTN